MSPAIHKITMLQKATYIILILSFIGLMGNYFSINLFFGVDFIFGSVAVLLALRVLGISAAIIIALITGVYTYFLWGHAYAMIIFVAEAITVGLFLRCKVRNLVLADMLFWVVLGMPLIWLFYSVVMDMSLIQAELILLKQPINGIVNAILASYILYLLPAGVRKKITAVNSKIYLHEVIFTVLLTFAVFSTLLIIVYQNHAYINSQESALKHQLDLQSKDIEIAVRLKYSADISDADLSNLIQRIQADNVDSEIIVAAADGEVLNSSIGIPVAEAILTDGGRGDTSIPGLRLYTPDLDNTPGMLRWRQSLYYVDRKIDIDRSFNVYILQYGNKITEQTQKNILTALFILLMVVIVATVTAYATSSLIVRSMLRLTRITADLPTRLQRNEDIQWPSSRIEEIDQLTDMTKEMANTIRADFDDMSRISMVIIESSTDAIVTCDEVGIIRGFNKSAELQFQYGRGQAIGQSVKLLLPLEQHAELEAFLRDPSSTQFTSVAPSHYQMKGQRQDGSTFPMEMSVTQIKLSNKMIFTGIITDISERRANERLKRDFISTVSHELRTPLTSIKASIKLLQADSGEYDSAKIKNLINISDRNVERLAVLIDDLLDFEKLDSGKFEYDLTAVDVPVLINEIVEEVGSFATQAGVKLITESYPVAWVYVDRQRLAQIVRNLLSNAIKFSPAGSSVEISCVIDSVDVRVTVSDHGKGIPDDFKDKIFKKFAQAESADDKQIQRGTGLGLAISKRMTNDMDGTIGFVSEAGHGSAFYVSFPVMPKEDVEV